MQKAVAAIFIIISSLALAQSNDFQVVFNSSRETAFNDAWLTSIKEMGADGVNLRVFANHFYDASTREVSWRNYDNVLRNINENGLDIYIRVNFVFIEENWEEIYRDPHKWFQVRRNGDLFRIVNDKLHRPIFNLTYDGSKRKMTSAFSFILNKLKQADYNIKYVAITLSPQDETEYPSDTYDVQNDQVRYELSGYSEPEREAFSNFLRNRYNGNLNNTDAANLNNAWNTDFNTINVNSINIRKFNWEIYDTNYVNPVGRKDFLDFRTRELANFIKMCKQTVTTTMPELKFGITFGSIYDKLIEFRGFYDPTILFEEADLIAINDGAEYALQFEFEADYTRTLCKFWGNNAVFATETNWPGYRSEKGLSSKQLVKYWIDQLKAFYDRGASILFLSHWWNHNAYDLNSFIDGSLFDDPYYENWKRTLNSYTQKPVIKNISNPFVVHLSCEQVLNWRTDPGDNDIFIRNTPDIPEFIENSQVPKYHYPICYFIKPRAPYSNQKYYNGTNCDIITNHMIRLKPDFILNYQKFMFSKTSIFMPDDIYTILVSPELSSVSMENITESDAEETYFSATTGLKDEYGRKRIPLRMMWRTRNDLQNRYPDLHFNSGGETILIKNDQPTYTPAADSEFVDYLRWLRNGGVRQYNDLKIPDSFYKAYLIQ